MISSQLNIFVIFGKFLWSNFHSTNIGVQSYCLHYLSLSIPFKFSVSIASQKCNLILVFHQKLYSDLIIFVAGNKRVSQNCPASQDTKNTSKKEAKEMTRRMQEDNRQSGFTCNHDQGKREEKSVPEWWIWTKIPMLISQ